MTDPRARRIPRLAAALAVPFLLFVLLLTACRKSGLATDPQLQKLHEQIQQDVPKGSSEEFVRKYLETHDYTLLPTDQPGVLVATTDSSPGATAEDAVSARVIFYFDANGKLNTFELSHR